MLNTNYRCFSTIFVVFLTVLLFLPATSPAQDFRLQKLVDSDDLVPGFDMPFGTSLFNLVGSDDGSIAFTGSVNLANGIYRFKNGVISTVAHRTTQTPGAKNFNFLFFSKPVALEGRNGLAFVATSEDVFSNEIQGIYLFRDGKLSKVIDLNDTIPGIVDPIVGFRKITALENDDLAFHVESRLSPFGGPFTRTLIAFIDGEYVKVADTNTIVPGGSGGTFAYLFCTGIFRPCMVHVGGNSMVFAARESGMEEFNLYIYQDGVLSVLANHETPDPGNPKATLEDFSISNVASLGGGNVAFIASNSFGERGIYQFKNGVLSRIVSQNDVFPNTKDNFVAFENLKSLPKGGLGFVGFKDTPAGEEGSILGYRDGVISMIVDVDQTVIAGMDPDDFYLGDYVSLGKGNNVAFYVVEQYFIPHCCVAIEEFGIYASINDNILTIADSNTLVPGEKVTFNLFGSNTISSIPGDLIKINRGNIVFFGWSGVGKGIYKSSVQSLTGK